MPVKKCSEKSAGTIIRKNRRILLIDRAFFPLGWACPAGHVKKGESAKGAASRETKEEVGLRVTSAKLLLSKKRISNKCVKSSKFHDWNVFECRVAGRVRLNKGEAKGSGWFFPEEIVKLKLEPIWEKWFKELKII